MTKLVVGISIAAAGLFICIGANQASAVPIGPVVNSSNVIQIECKEGTPNCLKEDAGHAALQKKLKAGPGRIDTGLGSQCSNPPNCGPIGQSAAHTNGSQSNTSGNVRQ